MSQQITPSRAAIALVRGNPRRAAELTIAAMRDEQDRQIAAGLARLLDRSDAILMAQGRKGRAS